MEAASAAVLPLVGVAIGVILSWGTNTLTERTRFRRQRATWLEDQQLQAAVEFSTAAKETMSILFRVAAGRGLDDQTEPLTLEDAEPLLGAAFHRREGAAERLRLLAAEEVFRAAQDWVRGIYDMRSATSNISTDREGWQRLVAAANAGRHRFHEAVRRTLLA